MYVELENALYSENIDLNNECRVYILADYKRKKEIDSIYCVTIIHNLKMAARRLSLRLGLFFFEANKVQIKTVTTIPTVMYK